MGYCAIISSVIASDIVIPVTFTPLLYALSMAFSPSKAGNSEG